jgi:hypothetical protein
MSCAARSIVTSALLFALSSPAFPNGTLCNATEEIIFSCEVEKGQTVSVCAARLTPEGAKVAYRFGSDKKIDLELVADTSQKSPPIEHNGAMGSRAYDYFVRFFSGEFSYTIQDHWDGCPGPGETRCKKFSNFTGVLVGKSEKLISRRTCTTQGAGIQTELLSKLKVPVSEKWPQ